MREDLRVTQADTDVRVQNYQYTFGFNGEPSNPIQARLIKIETLEERIKQLERITKPLTLLMENLNAPEVLDGSENKILYEILRLMYLGKNIPDAIIDELKIARRTFFKRRRNLVNLAVSYLGL